MKQEGIQSNSRKTSLLVSLGAGLEYYDFVVYAMFSPYLNTLFFPSDHGISSQFRVVGIFAIGYVARPLGGAFFGALGDKLGRKTTFLAVMLVMAISTFLIGLLPTYSTIGPLAGLLLLFLRFVQGLSFGGELPGAVTFVAENVKEQRRGVYCGLVMSSVATGSILASGTLHVLSTSLSVSQILSWGWRIPFFLGGLLAILGYSIRAPLRETPSFLRARRPKSLWSPLSNLVESFSRQILLGSVVVLFPACLVVFSFYAPEFLQKQFGYTLSDIYFSMSVGLLWSVLCLPFFGGVADRIGSKKLLVVSSVCSILCGFPMYRWMSSGNFTFLIYFMILLQTFISALISSYLSLLVSTFPTPVRYSGVAFCYNLGYLLAGLSPALFNFLISSGYPNASIFLVFLVLATGAIVSLFFLDSPEASKLDESPIPSRLPRARSAVLNSRNSDL